MQKLIIFCCMLLIVAVGTTNTMKKNGAHIKGLLRLAIQKNSLIDVKEILEKEKKLINKPLKNGFAALHLAVYFKHIEIIKYLLGLPTINANVHRIIYGGAAQGITPLHFVANDGSLEIIKLLGAHPKIRINIRDEWRRTPLHFASIQGAVAIIEYLCSLPQIAVNVRDIEGLSPIACAVKSGSLNAIKALCGCSKINLLYSDWERSIALHLAAGSNRTDIIAFFLSKKVPVDIENELGYTPLHVAALCGNEDAVNQLIGCEANVNATTKKAESPLSLSVLRGHYTVAITLLKNGAHMTESLWKKVCKNGNFSPVIDALFIDPFVKLENLNQNDLNNTGPKKKTDFYPIIHTALKNKQNTPLERVCRKYIQQISQGYGPDIVLTEEDQKIEELYFKPLTNV